MYLENVTNSTIAAFASRAGDLKTVLTRRSAMRRKTLILGEVHRKLYILINAPCSLGTREEGAPINANPEIVIK